MLDLFGKINEMKQQMEQTKQRLESMTVEADAENGKVKVVATGNHMIQSVEIAPELLSAGSKEELEDLLAVAINRAIKKADEMAADEMRNVTKGMMPDIPGLT